MVNFPRVTCKVCGLNRLETSESTFPSGAVADFVFQPSPEGCFEPRAGDVLAIAVRVSAEAAPSVASSAVLGVSGNLLLARLALPLVMAGASGVDSALDGEYEPGDDPFKPVAARLVLSRTVDLAETVMAVSPAVWLYPVAAGTGGTGTGDAYLTGPDGALYRLVVVNPEGLGLSLGLEEQS